MNQTPNFQLPIYTANDPTSYLVHFNGAMTAIDTAMENIKEVADEAKTTGDGAQGSVAQINQQLVNISNQLTTLQNDITALDASVSNIGVWTSVSVNDSILSNYAKTARYNKATKILRISVAGNNSSAIAQNQKICNLGITLTSDVLIVRKGFVTTSGVSLFDFTIKQNGDLVSEVNIGANSFICINTLLDASSFGIVI